MSKTIKQEKEEVREGWHRHKKGGGWVKDTASVSDDAYVDEDATVYGGVIRGGEIRGGEIWGGEIWGGVIWGGEIWGGEIWGGEIWGGEIRGGEIRGGVIRGGVIRGGEIRGGVIRGGEIRGGEIRGGVIWGGVIRTSPIQIQGPKWFVIEVEPGRVQIGCTTLTIPEWREKGLALAKENLMSEDHIAFYTAAIEFIERFGSKAEAPAETKTAETADA